jgi:hypothetical protein
VNVDKEVKRLIQKHYRSMDTNRRKAMIRWGRTKGRDARERYIQTEKGQRAHEARRQDRLKGGKYYEKQQEEFRQSREEATRGRKKWTCREEQKLVYLIDAGLNSKMIARIMDRSAKAIMQKRFKMGLGI